MFALEEASCHVKYDFSEAALFWGSPHQPHEEATRRERYSASLQLVNPSQLRHKHMNKEAILNSIPVESSDDSRLSWIWQHNIRTPGKNCPAKPSQPTWEIMINFCFERLSFGMVCHTMVTETIGFQDYFICTNHYDQFLFTTYYMSDTVLSILHLFHLIFTRTLWDSTYF